MKSLWLLFLSLTPTAAFADDEKGYSLPLYCIFSESTCNPTKVTEQDIETIKRSALPHLKSFENEGTCYGLADQRSAEEVNWLVDEMSEGQINKIRAYNPDIKNMKLHIYCGKDYEEYVVYKASACRAKEQSARAEYAKRALATVSARPPTRFNPLERAKSMVANGDAEKLKEWANRWKVNDYIYAALADWQAKYTFTGTPNVLFTLGAIIFENKYTGLAWQADYELRKIFEPYDGWNIESVPGPSRYCENEGLALRNNHGAIQPFHSDAAK